MTPIQAFNDTFQRAQRFMKLHNGLVNIRQRGIRQDWKESFNSLMHWRADTNIERVDSRDAVIILREDSTLVLDDFAASALDDQLRAALSFGVSALDRYVHERVVKGFVTAFRASELLRNQREFSVPATLAIEIVQRVHNADPDKNIRPANEIRKAIQKVLHKRPFQSWREVEYGFSLLGYKNLAGRIKEVHGINDNDVDQIKTGLGKIVDRRNQIVHEGDLPRHQRGGDATVREITPIWVSDSLDLLRDLANKLDAI